MTTLTESPDQRPFYVDATASDATNALNEFELFVNRKLGTDTVGRNNDNVHGPQGVSVYHTDVAGEDFTCFVTNGLRTTQFLQYLAEHGAKDLAEIGFRLMDEAFNKRSHPIRNSARACIDGNDGIAAALTGYFLQECIDGDRELKFRKEHPQIEEIPADLVETAELTEVEGESAEGCDDDTVEITGGGKR
jgi:hypothetical protein